MKKSLILVALVVLLLIMALIYGCNTTEDEVIEPDPENDNGEVAPEEPVDDSELPEGLPAFPEATFVGHSEGELEDEDIYNYQTTNTPQEVSEFYVEQFEAEGYEDFFYFYEAEMSEVQVQRNGYLVTVIADLVNETTEIQVRVRPFE